ncbi:MAG: LysR family transcriptional regulator [Mesorhizobium sp.]
MGKLKDMELFASVARERSFTRAAKATGTSPASISRRVAALESELGVQLISRTTRNVSLTEAGALYFARTQRILEEIADADEVVSDLRQSPRGVLRIHSRTHFGLLVVGPLLPEFQALHPEITIELTLSETEVRLYEEEFDLDLRLSPAPDPSIVQRRVLHARRVLVASPEYVAANPSVKKPADLLTQSCLGYLMPPQPVIWRFSRDGQLEELTMPARVSVNNGELLRQLALSGHGIALLYDFTVRDELAAGRLQQLLPSYHVTNTNFEGGVYAAYKQTPYLPRKIRLFLDFLIRHVSNSGAPDGTAPDPVSLLPT